METEGDIANVLVLTKKLFASLETSIELNALSQTVVDRELKRITRAAILELARITRDDLRQGIADGRGVTPIIPTTSATTPHQTRGTPRQAKVSRTHLGDDVQPFVLNDIEPDHIGLDEVHARSNRQQEGSSTNISSAAEAAVVEITRIASKLRQHTISNRFDRIESKKCCARCGVVFLALVVSAIAGFSSFCGAILVYSETNGTCEANDNGDLEACARRCNTNDHIGDVFYSANLQNVTFTSQANEITTNLPTGWIAGAQDANLCSHITQSECEACVITNLSSPFVCTRATGCGRNTKYIFREELAHAYCAADAVYEQPPSTSMRVQSVCLGLTLPLLVFVVVAVWFWRYELSVLSTLKSKTKQRRLTQSEREKAGGREDMYTLANRERELYLNDMSQQNSQMGGYIDITPAATPLSPAQYEQNYKRSLKTRNRGRRTAAKTASVVETKPDVYHTGDWNLIMWTCCMNTEHTAPGCQTRTADDSILPNAVVDIDAVLNTSTHTPRRINSCRNVHL